MQVPPHWVVPGSNSHRADLVHSKPHLVGRVGSGAEPVVLLTITQVKEAVQPGIAAQIR